MRSVLLLTLLAASPSVAQTSATTLQAQARVAVTLFQTSCLPTQSNFAAVSSLATQAGFKLIADRPFGGAHYKQWGVRDTTGLLSLHVLGNYSAVAPAKFMCGIFVPGGSAKAIEPLLSADSRLGAPSKRIKTDSKSAIIWLANLGPKRDSVQVILNYGTPRFAGITIDLAVGFPPE